MWYNAVADDASEVTSRGKGGAWSDTGGWHSWKRLCGAYEGAFFEVPNEDFYHAPPGPSEEQSTEREGVLDGHQSHSV